MCGHLEPDMVAQFPLSAGRGAGVGRMPADSVIKLLAWSHLILAALDLRERSDIVLAGQRRGVR